MVLEVDFPTKVMGILKKFLERLKFFRQVGFNCLAFTRKIQLRPHETSRIEIEPDVSINAVDHNRHGRVALRHEEKLNKDFQATRP